jgi:hypothetical protein
MFMKKGSWPVTAMAVSLAAAAMWAPARAGEVTFQFRLGSSDVKVNGDELISGQTEKDSGLLAAGFAVAYRWPKGAVIELSKTDSGDIFPILGFTDMEHVSLGAGWQFDMGEYFNFTPKAGMVYTSLENLQEDIWSGGEPVERFHDVVPFLELSVDGRIGKHFGIGMFWRRNQESFGNSSTYGLSVGWTWL